MKKLLLSLLLTSTAAFSAHAGLVLNEPFSYADGPLLSGSAGVWTWSSGTPSNTVDIASGKVNLTGAETEDLGAAFSGAPYNSGNLYASFTVNFSALPVGSGTYFAHLKDTTTGFRARIFSQTTGAATGQFRLAIGNAAAPVALPLDLSLNTDYLVVLRYNAATAAATLWINPGSENATANKADATDSFVQLPISAFGLRQSTGMGTLTMDNLKVGTAFSDVVSGGDPTANPPSISNIGNQSIPANTSTAAIPFNIVDGETAADSLVLTKSSANTTLIPNANIVFGGSGTNRTVTITPAAGQQGTTDVTVTVTDGNNNSASRTFSITVGAPSISAIANQATPTNVPSAAIAFTVSDTESAASALTVSATSNNETLVPVANVVFSGSGANRSAVITPGQDQVGTAIITFSVSDGINTKSSSFKLTVYPMLGIDLQDAFDYPDGSIVTNSSFTWNTVSAGAGQAGQTMVSAGQLLLTGTQGEDIGAFLNRNPYETNSGAILYSSYKVNVNTLPTSSSYFSHFSDSGSGFRARVWVTTNNAATGKYRLGISNGANTFDEWPNDLTIGSNYVVVTRYNVGTAESALWVNPTSEASQNVRAIDSTFPQVVIKYGFRQNTGMGALSVDDLKVGMAFSDVSAIVALPPSLNVSKVGNNIQLTWTTTESGYALESATSVEGPWAIATETVVPSGNNYSATINSPSGIKFYRLKK